MFKCIWTSRYKWKAPNLQPYRGEVQSCLKGPFMWRNLFALKGGLWKQQGKWKVVVYGKAATTKTTIFDYRKICIFHWTFIVIYIDSLTVTVNCQGFKEVQLVLQQNLEMFPISVFMKTANFHVKLIFIWNSFCGVWINMGYETNFNGTNKGYFIS